MDGIAKLSVIGAFCRRDCAAATACGRGCQARMQVPIRRFTNVRTSATVSYPCRWWHMNRLDSYLKRPDSIVACRSFNPAFMMTSPRPILALRLSDRTEISRSGSGLSPSLPDFFVLCRKRAKGRASPGRESHQGPTLHFRHVRAAVFEEALVVAAAVRF